MAIIFAFVLTCSAQQTDTLSTPKHSPRKATLLSAGLPGAGQIYNKKYWKLPIVYGGFGALGYFFYDNNKMYKTFKEAYKYRMDGDPNTIDNYPLYSPEGLLQAKNYYRRNTELTVIFSVILYALNILDAAVDAHLYDFDISDDLSLKLEPVFENNLHHRNTHYTALKLTLKF